MYLAETYRIFITQRSKSDLLHTRIFAHFGTVHVYAICGGVLFSQKLISVGEFIVHVKS